MPATMPSYRAGITTQGPSAQQWRLRLVRQTQPIERTETGGAERGQGASLSQSFFCRHSRRPDPAPRKHRGAAGESFRTRSEKTISRQKRTAMDKLGLGHDGGLVEFARVSGLKF